VETPSPSDFEKESGKWLIHHAVHLLEVLSFLGSISRIKVRFELKRILTVMASVVACLAILPARPPVLNQE
jgi:hypothetical protein